MKRTYKITVTSADTIIVPDVLKTGIEGFQAQHSYTQGEYMFNANTGYKYWAVTDGMSANFPPSHTLGVETGNGGIEWLALNHNRNVVISADKDNPIWISTNGAAVAEEGIAFQEAKAYAHGNSTAAINGISAGSDATIAVETSASAQ